MTDSRSKKPQSHLGRYLGLALTALVLIAAVGAFILARHAPELARDLIERQLVAYDLEPARFQVEKVGWTGVQLAHFELGDPVTLAFPRLFLGFTPMSLFSGRASRLEIDGLSLHATLGPDGISLNGLDSLLQPEHDRVPAEPTSTQTDFLARLPVDEVEIDEAQLSLETEDGLISGKIWLRIDDSRHLALRFQSGNTQGLEATLGFAPAPFSLNIEATLDPQRRSFDIQPVTIALTEPDDPDAVRVEAVLPEIAILQEGQLNAPIHAKARGGSLRLSQPSLAIEDFEFEIGWNPQTRMASGQIAIQEIRPTGSSALTAPLQLTAALLPTEDAIVADFDLTGVGRQLVIRGQVEQDLLAETGRAEFKMKPLDFTPEDRPIGSLFPVLKEAHVVASGRAGFHGKAHWGPEGFRTSLDLELDNMSLATPVAGAACLDGVIRLQGPPFSTPDTEELSMRLVNIGLILGEGRARYQLQNQAILTIVRGEWKFLGGNIITAGRYEFDASEHPLMLAAESISLQEVFAMMQIEGLSGEGVLGGHLPIVFREGRVEIRNGVLASSAEGGWIRYRPPAGSPGTLSGFGVSELVDFETALENFQFTRIVLQVEGDARGMLTLQASLEGANPDYRDGQPYKLNLNVEGPLYPLYERETGAFFTLPRRIEDRFMNNVGGTVPEAVALPDCKTPPV